MKYAAFRSIGAYIPSKIMTNADFEKIIDTNDDDEPRKYFPLILFFG